jgi:predicted dienelactone hydrolase
MKKPSMLLLLMLPAVSRSAYQAGHLAIATDDFRGHAWYPTNDTKGEKEKRYLPLPFTKKVRVIEGASLPQGKGFPLVLISHGILGRETSYSWLATELARKGYIVVAPHHTDQSREDLKEIELFRFWKRPRVISKAIDWALSAEPLRNGVNAGEIYFIGHSVGGHTGLMLAGLPFDIQTVMASSDTSLSRNKLAMRMKKAALVEKPSAEDMAENGKSYRDDRIGKFILLDPTPIYPGFGEQAFINLDKPVMYVGSSHSEIFNSDWVKAEIIRLNPNIKTEETHAGHFVFADEGTWLGRLMLHGVFVDADGIERARVHSDLLESVDEFFRGRNPAM